MKIIICGITGTIGLQTISVAIQTSEIEIVGCTFNKNLFLMKKINSLLDNVKIFSPFTKEMNNVDSLQEMINITKPDIIFNAIPGFDGLEISLLTLENKINLALANKESLVLAGWWLNDLALKNNVKIVPIDSEHCSLIDLLKNNNKKIKNIYITASGGYFYNQTKEELSNITYEQAIKNPNWNMGNKISIDSSTLMNKCFEIIEAFYLFNTKNIFALYHPQSLIHSLVEFSDNSIFSNISLPDMKLAIQITFNQFLKNKIEHSIINKLPFKDVNMHLSVIDENKYLPIKWANFFLTTQNKTIPIILVSANDAAIKLFENKKIKFNEILSIIENALDLFSKYQIKNISDIFNLNNQIKKYFI